MGARVLKSGAFVVESAGRYCTGRAGDAATKENLADSAVESTGDPRLARHPFLAGMNRRQLALLTGCATAVQFKKDK